MTDDPLQLAWERGAQARARLLDSRRRRRRRLRVVVAVLAAVALLGGAMWVWLLRDDGGTPRARVVPPTISFEPTSPFVAAPTCREPLTADDPLRLWIGGDSLAGSLGPALAEMTADTGVVLPTYDYRTSSGLASPSFFDWPEHAAEEMVRVDPEVVVFIIGANDSGFVRSEPVDGDGEPAWRGFYAQLVSEMLDVLSADERAVYWVGSPTLRDERKNDDVREINDVAREVVAQRDRATYVDAYELFADSSGEYTATLPGADGKDVRVRPSDGIHFTPAGADLLGEYAFAYLDERCALADQAVPGQRQPVRRSPGSGEVPGTNPSTSSSSSSTSSTTPSTTPSTTTTSTTTSTLPTVPALNP